MNDNENPIKEMDSNERKHNVDILKLYCCLFPKDYEFEKITLILLWTAIWLNTEDDYKNLFDDLLKEQYICFSREDIRTRRRLYKVDLDKVTRFASLSTVGKIIKTKDRTTLLLEDDFNTGGSKSRHISIVSDGSSQSTFKELPFEIETSESQSSDSKLRTLLFVRNYGSSLKKLPRDMFLALEHVKALDLSGCHIVELPSSIGNARQLRYLDLSFTLIESLPESIDQLGLLQTFRLQGCKHLHELPGGIEKLICLCHLYFDVFGQLTLLPKGIGFLTKLCTLSAFIIGSKEGCSIKDLKGLNMLKGSLCISGLENVSCIEDVHEAALSDKKHLTRLQLRWDGLKLYRYEDQERADKIIASLNLNEVLKELQITCFPGLKMPAWVDISKHCNLIRIKLINCENSDLKLPLGQLSNLKYLDIIHMDNVKEIDDSFRGAGNGAPFPSLEELQIDCMYSLETWIISKFHEDFKSLSRLIIKQCPKLTGLSFLHHLKALKHLEIIGCDALERLTTEETLSISMNTLIIYDCQLLEKSCLQDGADWPRIKHIPHISIDLQHIHGGGGGSKTNFSTTEESCSTHKGVAKDDNSTTGECTFNMELQTNSDAQCQSQPPTLSSPASIASSSSSHTSFDELMKTMELMEERPINLPIELYKGVVLNKLYQVSSAKLNAVIFSPDLEFAAELAKLQGKIEVNFGPWGFQNGSLERQNTYFIMTPSFAYVIEKETYKLANGKHFTVSVSVSTQDVESGSRHGVELFYHISPGPILPSGKQYSRLVVSWEKKFVRKSMSEKLFQNEAQEVVRKNIDVLSPHLDQFFKSPGLKKDRSSLKAQQKLILWKLAVALCFVIYGHIQLTRTPLTIVGLSLRSLEFFGLDLPDSFGEFLVSACLTFCFAATVALYFLRNKFEKEKIHHGLNAQRDGRLLTVTVMLIEGSNLIEVDASGFSKTFVVFTCNGKRRVSSIKLNKPNREWNNVIIFDNMDELSSVMKVEVLHFDDGPSGKATSLGHAEITIPNTDASKAEDLWVPLEGKQAKSRGSKLRLKIF